MNLHEYQAKQLFADYSIPIPNGTVASSGTDAIESASTIGGDRWVIKAQIHSGGRGKAGGVILADSIDRVKAAADQLLGTRLVTQQSLGNALPVHTVLVEAAQPARNELYLSVLADRASANVMFIASAAGGMDIEEIAREFPEKILQVTVDPASGLQDYHSRIMAFGLGLDAHQHGEFRHIVRRLYQLLLDKDLLQIEINPLIVTEHDTLVALDAKITIDDNALYAHPDIAQLRDIAQEDAAETAAREHDLSYVTLDGTIGCMVNGAGLAMATMDVIKLHGGEPSNFLDVGGGTTAAKVAEALKLILLDSKVRVVLVNIFGGIVRCDLIAEGIIAAIGEVGVAVPVVVRLEGTHATEGRQLLEKSGLALMTASDLDDAAKKAVEATR